MRSMRIALVISIGTLIAGCTHVKMGLFLFHDNLTENDPGAIVRGKELFISKCADCHGEHADGKGKLARTLAITPTDFRAPGYDKPATRLAGHISYGKGDAMPAFADQLDERSIWDIANYLHSLQTPTP